jgi:hypothetical protein
MSRRGPKGNLKRSLRIVVSSPFDISSPSRPYGHTTRRQGILVVEFLGRWCEWSLPTSRKVPHPEALYKDNLRVILKSPRGKLEVSFGFDRIYAHGLPEALHPGRPGPAPRASLKKPPS